MGGIVKLNLGERRLNRLSVITLGTIVVIFAAGGIVGAESLNSDKGKISYTARQFDMDKTYGEAFIEPFPPGLPRPTKSLPPGYVPKAAGHYSKQDWAAAIDATWGGGPPRSEQIGIWSEFWQTIDENFACFHGLDPDVWTNIYNAYDAEINDSVSLGRFTAILMYACMALEESHTKIYNPEVTNTPLEPGVPLMVLAFWGDHWHFGAGLTPLPDSSLLVYKTLPDHPLDLEPGDIVLGYDGIPWKNLVQELISYELPIVGRWGSNQSSVAHCRLISAGQNWHLFDTIDIRRYGTEEVEHLPTSLMIGQSETVWATEQMDIPGVSFPDYQSGQLVSWGIMEGTSIGYIYAWGWFNDAGSEWTDALSEIMGAHQTTGLIIDFRLNWGGNMWLAYTGLEMLFNETVETIGFAGRCFPEDHFEMCSTADPSDIPISGNPGSYYDKPIAVLVGPGAVSSGDQIALAMSFHPMAKMFGKPTTSAFNSPVALSLHPDFPGRFAPTDAYLGEDPNNSLTHKEFPDPSDFPGIEFEEVWLDRDGVAEGRDGVVEAAMAWIIGLDIDQDGFLNDADNCPEIYNPDQADADFDNVGDVCEACGDANGDNSVNVGDAVYLVSHVFKDTPGPVPACIGDANGDSSINIGDAVYLVNLIFNLGPDPVEPCCVYSGG